MTRCASAVALLGLCTLMTRDAAGAPPGVTGDAESPMARRRGFYLRGSLGVANVGGPIHANGNTISLDGRPSRRVSLGSAFDGSGVAADGAIGYAPVEGVAVALEGGAIVAPAFSKNAGLGFGGPGVDGLYLFYAGGLVDWYPRPRGPLHLEVAAAVASATFSGGEDTVLTENSFVGLDQLDAQHGFLTRAGIGYTWRAGRVDYGVTLRILRGRLWHSPVVTDIRGSELALSVTWF